MGKCSGLKAGGHHRKALDVAEKKRKEKEARKKEQELAGQRAIILQEILMHLDPDCDVYLDAKENNGINNDYGHSMAELCRSHFRFEDCSNRRCKYSHEHSIAEALGNVMSGTCSGHIGNEDDTISASPTIPALRLIPGIVGDRGIVNRKRKDQQRRSRRKQSLSQDKSGDRSEFKTSWELGLQSPFENALLEGSSSMNTIVAFLESNMDVLHLALSCRHVHNLVMIGDTSGEGCRDVQRRKYKAKEAKLQQRNGALLKSKSVSGRLRYAVSYVECSHHAGMKGRKSKRKNRKSNDGTDQTNSCLSMRPILIYDYENPHVFQAYRESGIKSKIGQLSKSFSTDCQLKT